MFGSFRHVCCLIFQHNRFLWPASYQHEGVNGMEYIVCRLKYPTVLLRSLRKCSMNLSLDQPTFERLEIFNILKLFRGCRSGYKVKSTQQARISDIQVITQTRRICILNAVPYINKLNGQTSQRCYLVPLNRAKAPASQLSTITLLNSRSLLPKIDELSIFLAQYRSDISYYQDMAKTLH